MNSHTTFNGIIIYIILLLFVVKCRTFCLGERRGISSSRERIIMLASGSVQAICVVCVQGPEENAED